MKNKIVLLILTMNIMLLSTGCWNYKEISERYFVSGFAIDYDIELDRFDLTVEIAVPKLSEGKFSMEPLIAKSSGTDCFDSIRNVIPKLGRKLTWSHSKVLVLGTSVFEKEGILEDIIDFLDRTVETREDMWILVSREKTAGEILTGPGTEIQNIKSFVLDESLRNVDSISKYQGMPAWRLTSELSSTGISPALPTVQFAYVNGIKVSLVWGEAILKSGKIVGWLNGDETRDMLMVNGDFKQGIYTINDIVLDKKLKATIEIKSSETKTETIVSGKDVTVNIKLNIKAAIVEMSSSIDITKTEERETLIEFFNSKLENELEASIKRTQNECKCDIYGFGQIVRRQHYEDWSNMEYKWQNMFPNIKTDVKVDIELLGSSIKSKPREVKR